MSTITSPEMEIAWEGVLSKVRTFPTLPTVVNKINELVSQPETSAKDIEVVIAKDQVLTGKLLRLVNSPFYGFPQKVTTISRAVGIIGFEALRNLIFSSSVVNLFRSNGTNIFRPAEFWKHSVGTALAAKELARHLGERQVEEFFVGGLIHDIGKLVHEEYFGDPFRQACTMALRNDILLREAEQEVMHFTHDQTGGLLLAQWNLPPKVVAMVRFHHQPAEAREYRRDAGVIHLADILSRAKGFGSGGDNKIPMLDHATWAGLGLTIGDLEQVLQRIGEHFDEAVAFLER
jgi:putative nucleotidyltransferase with HDIG domain